MSTFVSTGCALASGKKALSLATHISDMIDGDTAGLSLGHAKDEPDEAKTTNRIKIALPIVIKTGMETFLHEVVPLPLEFHAQFTSVTGPIGENEYSLAQQINKDKIGFDARLRYYIYYLQIAS